jgi:hypothetical protein
MMMDSEKRTFARLDLYARAHMRLDDQNIAGEIVNLSVKGAFVTVARPMGLNAVVALTINDTPICDLKAKVVRVAGKGMGLQFEKALFQA